MLSPEWIAAIATAIYALLTIAICVSNAITANATRKQTQELILQREQTLRPNIKVMFDNAKGEFHFKISNVGSQNSYNTTIRLNQEFIDNLKEPFNEIVNELNKTNLLIAPGQTLMVPIGFNTQFKSISKIPAVFDIAYCDKKYQETIVIDISQYGFSLIEKTAIDDIAESIKKVQEQIKQSVADVTKAINKIKTHEITAIIKNETEHDKLKRIVLNEVSLHPFITLGQLEENLELDRKDIHAILMELCLNDGLINSSLSNYFENPNIDSMWQRS